MNDRPPDDTAADTADAGGALDMGDAEDGGIHWPEGRIDVVAEPVRYRRGPVLALLVVAILPAIGLFRLHHWADDEADRYEAEVERLEQERSTVTAELDVAPPSSVSGEGVPSSAPEHIDDADARVELATDLLSYRRAPTATAGLANARSLAATLDDFTARLDPTTCFTASVEGIRVAAHSTTRPVIPASNQKLLIAAAALDLLGVDHTFETSVAVPTPVDGVVEGDVYLIGGGDPVLTSDDFPVEEDRQPAFNTTSLDPLADAVAATGVTRINGAVIGDGTRYDDEFTVGSWAPGIAGVDAGPYDALFVNDARVLGRSGRESDPNSAAAREFVRLLNDRGIVVAGGWGSGSRSNLVPVVGTVTSRPLADIVAQMLTTSDNDTAELLVKELGHVVRGEGTRPAGLEVVRQWLVDQGVTMLGVELADGSGLSNDNRLTCDAVLTVLQLAGDDLVAALPVAGRTGTLADEFVGAELEGRLVAKTGTLNRGSVDPPSVKALSGLVPSFAGTIEFALISNTPGIAEESAYQVLWNALAERLASHPAGADIDALGPVVEDT